MKHVLAVTVPASITAILLHRENGLLAVTCDDLVVRVVDIETRRVVRELSGFRGTILDLVTRSSFLLVSSSLNHPSIAGLFIRLAMDHGDISRLCNQNLRCAYRTACGCIPNS